MQALAGVNSKFLRSRSLRSLRSPPLFAWSFTLLLDRLTGIERNGFAFVSRSCLGTVRFSNSSLSVRASLNEDGAGGYFLSIAILAEMPGLDRAKAAQILATAHKTCPYSKPARGESKIDLRVV